MLGQNNFTAPLVDLYVASVELNAFFLSLLHLIHVILINFRSTNTISVRMSEEDDHRSEVSVEYPSPPREIHIARPKKQLKQTARMSCQTSRPVKRRTPEEDIPTRKKPKSKTNRNTKTMNVPKKSLRELRLLEVEDLVQRLNNEPFLNGVYDFQFRFNIGMHYIKNLELFCS